MSSAQSNATPMGLPARISLRDVGPRDGLQIEAPIAVEDRVRLIELLIASGIRRIEAGSFVSPKAVPAMAGSAEVFARVPRRADVTLTALVPNRRGAEAALEAHADELTVICSASETYSMQNVRMTIAQSLEAAGEICALAGPAGVPVEAVVSCSFGSPYEGDIAPEEVRKLAQVALDRGATRVTLADTTGMATPRRVRELLDVVGTDVGLHLHETRGTAMLNAYVAMQVGVTSFDTSVGGLGGSPFAAGAAGNLATEDFVAMLDDIGVETGIDLERLLEASTALEALVGHPLASRVAAAGPRLPRA
jgi:hydroxymethylglutaryl-CoA lyase